MGMNPLKNKGTPLEEQVRSWNELNSKPYNRNEVHPYTRSRILLMNAVETEEALFSHDLLRQNDNPETREKITLLRRSELQQQKLINWLVPPEESPIEQAMGYEQAEVDLTAWLARTEPDPYVKKALNFGLLEDLDHLYRFANLYDLMENGDAEKVVGDLTEVLPGRPTADQHQFPFDTVRRNISEKTDILTRLHLLTMKPFEQQTMLFYMNAGNRILAPLGRGLFQEIAMTEEQHLTLYNSLNGPGPTALEMLLLHQYHECYLYYSCLESETDSRIKSIWAQMLENEIEHVKTAAFLLGEVEGRDPESVLPSRVPKLTIFDSNKEYIRAVLNEQMQLTALGEEYLPYSKLPPGSEYHSYQKAVKGEGGIPSMQVIGENIRRNGQDYRIESRGQHPVEGMRVRNTVQRITNNISE